MIFNFLYANIKIFNTPKLPEVVPPKFSLQILVASIFQLFYEKRAN